jgi:hypothetical protein
LPSKRFWQCASAEVHMSAKLSSTTNSGDFGPYGSTRTSSASRSTEAGIAPPWTPPKWKSGL